LSMVKTVWVLHRSRVHGEKHHDGLSLEVAWRWMIARSGENMSAER